MVKAMTSPSRSKKMDFTEGPIFWKMLIYALPIMGTSILQNLYNVADKVVVGQFSGDDYALGAIGSTSFVSALVTNFLIGVGAGVGVLVSQLFGAGERERVKRAVSTSLVLAVLMSLIMTVIAYVSAEPLLVLLNTKDEYFEGALLYLRLTFIGLLAVAVYNIGASMLRAVGDSKTPLVIGAVSGAINVVFNIFFVIVCGMSIDGVAIATVISQYFSAIAVVVIIFKKQNEPYHITIKGFVFDSGLLTKMLWLGIPTGLQSAAYSVTSMITAWAVNSFPPAYVTARSIALDIDHIAAAFTGAFLQSTMTATGQNFGAKRSDRVKKVFVYGLIQSFVVSFAISMLMFVFRADIASLFVSTENRDYAEIIAATTEWSGVMLSLYFIQGILNAVSGSIRGMGYSMSSLIANLIGACGTRIIWVYVFFPLEPLHTFSGLALLYPVSWGVASILLAALCIYAFAKLKKDERLEPKAASEPTPTE